MGPVIDSAAQQLSYESSLGNPPTAMTTDANLNTQLEENKDQTQVSTNAAKVDSDYVSPYAKKELELDALLQEVEERQQVIESLHEELKRERMLLLALEQKSDQLAKSVSD